MCNDSSMQPEWIITHEDLQTVGNERYNSEVVFLEFQGMLAKTSFYTQGI